MAMATSANDLKTISFLLVERKLAKKHTYQVKITA